MQAVQGLNYTSKSERDPKLCHILLRLLFSIWVVSLLTHCQSPSDQIKDAFKSVDNSLRNSNEVLSRDIKDLYLEINVIRQLDEQLGLKADSIYLQTVQAIRYMEGLKTTMAMQDSTGTRLDVASNLLVGTACQQELTIHLTKVYREAISFQIKNADIMRLDSALVLLRKIQADTRWTQEYFERIPTMAAITILSKIQSDCCEVAAITLSDIKQQLIKLKVRTRNRPPNSLH